VGRVVELPNGNLASIGYDNTVRIWFKETGMNESLINIANRGYNPYLLTTIPNGNLAATRTSAPFNIQIFSPITGEVLQTLIGHSSRVSGKNNLII
jgi:WD40 repeat protein